MPARVYHPDHTAHIRHRLSQMAIHGAAGLIVAAGAAGVLALIDTQAGDSYDGISRIAWYGVATVVGLSLLTLLLTLAGWIRYRRHRPDLDAAGAEAIGELYARMANARHDDDQR